MSAGAGPPTTGPTPTTTGPTPTGAGPTPTTAGPTPTGDPGGIRTARAGQKAPGSPQARPPEARPLEARRPEERPPNARSPEPSRRPAGVRLGVDVGTVRVGVAASDPAGVLATPLVTLPRAGSVAALAALVVEHRAVEVVVGLPRSLSGRDGPAAALARDYAAELQRAFGVPVHLADERLTTVIASRTLAERGVRGRRRRAVVDQIAAVLILQSWLDNQPHPGPDPSKSPSGRVDADDA